MTKYRCKHCGREDTSLRSYGIIAEGGDLSSPTKFVHEQCWDAYVVSVESRKKTVAEMGSYDFCRALLVFAHLTSGTIEPEDIVLVPASQLPHLPVSVSVDVIVEVVLGLCRRFDAGFELVVRHMENQGSVSRERCDRALSASRYQEPADRKRRLKALSKFLLEENEDTFRKLAG